jgi:hypothetical protein
VLWSDTTGVTDLIPFRRQKEAVANKQTTPYHDPDGDDEALDALLSLFGNAALKQKRSETKHRGKASEVKDGKRKRGRTPPPDSPKR